MNLHSRVLKAVFCWRNKPFPQSRVNALLAVMILLPALAFSQELPAIHYTTEKEINPLPNPAVTGIYQDRLGYLWLCAYGSGLARYDGHKMEIYGEADSLASPQTWIVIEDSTGRLWVGTDRGLSLSAQPLADYSPGERVQFRSRFGNTRLYDKRISYGRQIALDVQGQIWLATRADGIIRYRWQSSETLVVDTLSTAAQGQRENLRVPSVAARRNGTVSAAVNTKVFIYDWRGQVLDTLRIGEASPKANTNLLYEGRSGTLYGADAGGTIWKLEEKRRPAAIEIIYRGLKHPVASLWETTEGNLWIASLGSGAVELEHNRAHTARIYGSKQGLLGEVFWDVQEDREGNLWLAQNSGLSKLPFNFRAYQFYSAKSYPGHQPNLPASGVMAVAQTSTPASGRILWAGTESGLVAIAPEGRTETLNSEHGLVSNIVFGVAQDRLQRLWIATRAGVNCLSPQTGFPHLQNWPSRRLSLFDATWHLTGDAVGQMNSVNIYALKSHTQAAETVESVWGGTQDEVRCLVDGQWFIFRQAAGVPAGRIWTTAIDPKGHVWFSSAVQGAYRSRTPLTVAEFNKWETKTHEFSTLTKGKEVLTLVFEPVLPSPNNAPTSGLVWIDSLMWVASDSGVLAIQPEPPKIVARLTQQDGLTRDGGFALNYSSPTRRLWVGTIRGLNEIDPVGRTVLRTVTKQTGLSADNCWGIAAVSFAEDGTVCYGTSNGLQLYHPEYDRANTIMPVPRLRNAAFRENEWGQNEILLEYAGLSFANEKLVKYKTRLAGYDQDWSESTSENKIRYTNLPAFLFSREYIFEVMACNSSGLWTEAPLQHAFTVKPPWWLRWWAMALQLGLVAGAVVAVQRYRTRQLREHSRILEHSVQERTAEIRAQKESLERLGQIGKEITASLEFDTIFDRLYEHVNRLCDATVFGVGIFQPDKQEIEYRLAVENGKRYAPYRRDTSDKNQFPVWCIEQQLPVFINDVTAEYGKYLSEYKDSRRVLEDCSYSIAPQSLIYLPLLAQERVLGVITVQSHRKNAYNEYQLNLLQNLAAYTTIALDNADAYRRLNITLEHLTQTQQQLVTQEKLASLGQLTAGIAHEIKNPLNFVNNFAAVTVELAKELREEIAKLLPKTGGNDEGENLTSILNDLERSAEKINQHGTRADGIVRSMLQLSRGKSGEREWVDINALLEEAVNLTYHGMRAQEAAFNITIEKDYDPAVGKLRVVPQDLSRVFLNILSNACHAAHLKARESEGENGRNGEMEKGGEGEGVSGKWGESGAAAQPGLHSPPLPFMPTLSVSTNSLDNQVEIRIRDNGNGIPAEIRDKIFNPFFTTKLTGQGTGLGLSISYDIIVQQHAGEIEVETEAGQFTEFVVRLPKEGI